MPSSQLRPQAASADLPVRSQLWHPGHGGHRSVPVYENCCFSNYPASHTPLSTRWGKTLPMAKETLFLPSLFASSLEPMRKHWSHSTNISTSFQIFFVQIPTGCFPPNTSDADGHKPQQFFILEEQSLLEQHWLVWSLLLSFLAIYLPGYSRAGAGKDPRNLSSLVASSKPRKHSLPPSPRLTFWSFLQLHFSAHNLSLLHGVIGRRQKWWDSSTKSVFCCSEPSYIGRSNFPGLDSSLAGVLTWHHPAP